MASSFGYASASGHGCRGPGTNLANLSANLLLAKTTAPECTRRLGHTRRLAQLCLTVYNVRKLVLLHDMRLNGKGILPRLIQWLLLHGAVLPIQ